MYINIKAHTHAHTAIITKNFLFCNCFARHHGVSLITANKSTVHSKLTLCMYICMYVCTYIEICVCVRMSVGSASHASQLWHHNDNNKSNDNRLEHWQSCNSCMTRKYSTLVCHIYGIAYIWHWVWHDTYLCIWCVIVLSLHSFYIVIICKD